MKRFFLLAVSLCLAFGAVLPPAGASAQSGQSDIDRKKEAIKERHKQIQQIEKEKKAKAQDLQSLVKQIDEMKQRLAVLNDQVYQTEQQLQQSKTRLSQLEKQLEKRQVLFRNRVRQLYMQGNLFYFEALIKSDSFAQFLSRLYWVREVVKADRQLITGFQKDRQEVARQKSLIEQQLQQKRQQMAEAEGLHKQLIAEYRRNEAQLAQLEQQQSQLEDLNEQDTRQVQQWIAQRERELEKRASHGEKGVQALPTYRGGKFYWPVDGGRLTSKFGLRYHPIKHRWRLHAGIDIAAPLGTPIHAAADGVVMESRPARGYGWIVVIYHGNNLATLYAHVYPQDVRVSVGQHVSRGQVIAAVGNNGVSTGPHVHVEVHKNGEPVDPLPFFR
ncbi:murein hydrolase activator EnvC family protein [Polycladomyces subterraneus]|uniref:Peptidoglycan DD-metalloendopeptidase family protein n=1 Tax=Polycladomyces subterraneus TaxID=1016997 RepID=A0ABT8IQK1_9BACL|nr:M23 family metallopeptidase [Polycladomyces subterraneus]MDN4594389.1 peptidoglycan DD-metalloendopeptidase family protein [Polycladomyces subterraneus]